MGALYIQLIGYIIGGGMLGGLIVYVVNLKVIASILGGIGGALLGFSSVPLMTLNTILTN